MIKFRHPKRDDVQELMKLFFISYNEERKLMNYLPDEFEIGPYIEASLYRLVDHGKGYVRLKNNKITSYMIGYKTGPLFGKELGMYIPVFGHGAKNYSLVEYIELYNHTAQLFIKEFAYSHAISIFTFNTDMTIDFFNLGFGNRCVDALTEVKELPTLNSEVVIKKASESDLQQLESLHQAHHVFYREAPIFMPNPDEDALADLTSWMNEKHRHLWMAMIDDQVVGYMRIEPEGESIISEHSSIMNITGAFVHPKYRNKHIGHELIKEIMNWLKQEGYPLIGVDYESINPHAMLFWERFFTPYSFSLTRRIDERIIDYIK